MVEKVVVDRDVGAFDGKRRDAKPLGIDVVGGLARGPLAKKHDVGHDGGTFAFERVGGQPDRAHEVCF